MNPMEPTQSSPRADAPRIGILGGTFNPPHRGHLHAATLAKDALALDQVLFIPTNIPPHKALPRHTASAADRCEMVRLLLQGIPWAALDDLEIRRGGASYTVDTLRALAAREHAAFYLIVGTDMLLSFDRIWRAPEEIAQRATLAVCARADEDWEAIERKAALLRRTLHARIALLRGDSLTISSTELRERGAQLKGEPSSENGARDEDDPLTAYVPPAVADFIRQNHLYGF